MQEISKKKQEPSIGKVVLEVNGLTKAYGNTIAVNNLDILIEKGEIFGLLGHNGAGKTTTIECILNTRKKDSGSIAILGLQLEKDRKRIFERVGVQMQEAHFQEKIKVKEICENTSALYSNPLDYNLLLKDFSLYDRRTNYVSELSGGQRQKLSVLIALLSDPQLLFLDELTTGLDPKARREIWKYLDIQKQKGKSILLTSHYMDEVQYLCDRICILKNGSPQITGTTQEVILKSGTQTLEEAYLFYTGEEVEYESI
ncbi:MAG: ABC transporter ATP-binding protein [Clostridiaceae bacterium]|nr:ABC transporter ATP-binding protein [Clostridiaceae bacterium]